ncbi:MAG: type II toxin-antitoxin system HicB family antitoxin [Thiohalocapsa sp.]|nr:type II toxin-antitoxin system HicB family antitoxin [Thiohalocapsa sp.]
MRYTVIVEEGDSSFGAYVPNLTGCVAAGETREEALLLIAEAITFHIEGLRESGEDVPAPHTFVETVEVTA